MTNLGKIFEEKLVNKSAISRITGISSARLSELSRNENTVMKAKEMYLIALALEIPVEEFAKKLYSHLKLKK
ncbi:helix-turn-helix domain-containing protein [Chryseobacterium koreense]|uniref:helix-turn-helix domain-containing protein n=1 Tax=Chryseobacterium koreense TaxID=232216 RepID=UPI0026F1158A|nr:helix-turn-helix domain-containing protein [Chryseobacterium koreense]